jgi:hypothetical protein
LTAEEVPASEEGLVFGVFFGVDGKISLIFIKTGNTTEQYISYLQTSRKLMIQSGGLG